MLHCNSCGNVEPNKEDVSLSDIHDQLEAGEIDFEEYEELAAGSRFACSECASLDTEEYD